MDFDYEYNGNEFDLYILELSELNIIVNYLKQNYTSHDSYTFVIQTDPMITKTSFELTLKSLMTYSVVLEPSTVGLYIIVV